MSITQAETIPGYVTGEYLCAEQPSASEKTGA